MKQQQFEAVHGEFWQSLESANDVSSHFTADYRRICGHLAIAKKRRYSPVLIARLNAIAVAGHDKLYGARRSSRPSLWGFLAFGFAIAIRKNWRYVLAASVLFLVPLIGMAVASYANENVAYTVIDRHQAMMFEEMYNSGDEKLGRERDEQTDILMFGHYIRNNIGISFQAFAGGLLWGLGSLFVLIFNGLYIGTVMGYLAQAGHGGNFFPFVAGHGSFELTAIVFSGAAGLKLGSALIFPSGRSWKTDLVEKGRDAMLIIYGSTIMLLIAAFIEAFWSSAAAVDASTKYVVGASLWVLVITYCVFAGRRHEA